MKYLKPFFCFVAPLLLLLSEPAFGQSQPPKEHYHPIDLLQSGDLASNGELKVAFGKLRSALEGGAELQVFNHSNHIIEIMDRLGTRNLFSLADMCIAIGRAAGAKGKKLPAVLAGESAVKFAPDYSSAHFFLASALFALDKKNSSAIGSSLVAGMKALLSDRIGRESLVSSAIIFSFSALLLMFILSFIAFFSVHMGSFISDVGALFPSSFEGKWRYILGALVIIAPFAFGGMFLFLLALPLFLWPYLRGGGRAVVIFFALFLICIPSVFDRVAKSSAITNSETFQALYLLSRHTWDFESKKSLENELLQNSQSRLVSFSMGLLNKLRKENAEAINSYDAVLERYPQDVKAIVNKGNVYFITRKYKDAMNMYKMAIKIDPQLLEAHFNLSNTYVMMFRTKESEAEYMKALSIDPGSVQSFVARAGQSHDKKVIDFSITDTDLGVYENMMGEQSRSISQASWQVYFGPIPRKIYQGVTIGFAFLVLFSHFFWRSAISHQTCVSCGTPFRPPLLLPASKPKCTQCVAANISHGGIASVKKDRKIKEIRLFMDKRAWVASLMDRILPGMGRTYFEDHAKGILFTFITSLILVYGVSIFISELFLYGGTPREALGSNVIYLGATGVYWILMNTVMKKDFY